MATDASRVQILEPTAGSRLTIHRGWLSSSEAATLMTSLIAELAWEQRDVVLFGRRVPQPRLIAWAGDIGYRYSGQTLPPRPTPPSIAAVLRRVVEATGTAFNHVLVNRYRDGRDGMGLHADDESELGPEPTVASLSLGETRRFVVRARERHAEPLTVDLDSGTLLVMSGSTQRTHRHGIPKTTRPVGERLSLTFRQLLRSPP